MSTTPEPIVVSLERAKELKEAGWPQSDGLFIWSRENSDGYGTLPNGEWNDWSVMAWSKHWNNGPWEYQMLAAPTAEEILRRLPDHIPWNGRTVPLLVSYRAWSSRGWNVRYATGLRYGDEQAEVVSGDSLANAAASMWIYLKHNNLLPSA